MKEGFCSCFPTEHFCCSGLGVEGELGCAGPFPELQEGFMDIEVFKEDFQDIRHPIVCCSFINLFLHQEEFVWLIFSSFPE